MRLPTASLWLLSALGGPSSAHILDPNHQQPLTPQPPRPISHTTPESEAPPYRPSLLTLHRALVNIPSISGSESDVARFLQKTLTHLNYTVTLQRVPSPGNPPLPPRYNVLALPGRGANTAPRDLDGRVLVTSHIDVVPPFLPYAIDGVVIPPRERVDFTAVTGETVISGRGSVDAKASVAAQIIALETLFAESSVPRDAIALLFVVSEESTGQGMKHFSASLSATTTAPGGARRRRRPQFRAAIFGEPTDGRLACGHKGITFGSITAAGKAGHSGYPWLGKSATGVLIKALGRLLEVDLGGSERFGNTTVNVGVVEGGVAANVIAKEARAEVAIRIAVGSQETGAAVVAEGVRRVLEGVDGESLRLELGEGYGPVECECDVEGFDTMIANYGTDVPNLDGDHVRYLYGPGSILVAHGDDEGLQVKELEDAVEGYRKLILHAVNSS